MEARPRCLACTSIPRLLSFETGRQVPVWRLTTSRGIEVTATPNHRFLTPGGYRRLDELEYGDTLLLQSGEGTWSTDAGLPEVGYGAQESSRLRRQMRRAEAAPPTEWARDVGEVLGYAMGDGYVRRDATAKVLGLAFDQSDEDVETTIRERILSWFSASGNRTPRQGHIEVTYKGAPATFMIALGLGVIDDSSPSDCRTRR